jgi:GntR family transcriptional repressor for pyruvate dehydrogenase complex
MSASSLHQDAATDAGGLRRLSTEKVVDRVASELLRLIGTNQLSAGDKLLAEPELARQLGVGRSTVREAKQVLIARGFLKSRGKVGTYVAEAADRRVPLEMLQVLLTERRVEELHQARNIVEVGAIRLTCQYATDAELSAIEAQLDELARAGSDDEFWAGAVSFHQAIVRACHNTTVSYLVDSLSDAMRADQLPIHARENDRLAGIELHRRLISALRTRNPDAAAAAMTEHLAQSHHHDLTVLHGSRR